MAARGGDGEPCVEFGMDNGAHLGGHTLLFRPPRRKAAEACSGADAVTVNDLLFPRAGP